MFLYIFSLRRRCIKIVRARELFPQILLFDVWLTISKDVEVYSIVIHWFLKASGFFCCWEF